MSELILKLSEEELGSMPEIVRTKAVEKDGVYVYEGPADGLVEDVHGLKSALGKERDAKRNVERQYGQIREKLGLADDGDPLNAIDALANKGRSASEATLASTKARIISDIAAAGGNAHILSDKMFNEVKIDPDTGKVSVVDENGVAKLREDGEPMDHRDVLKAWKNDPLFSGNFIGTKQTGGGSMPAEGGGRNPIAQSVMEAQTDTGAPPKTKPVSKMTARERMLAATVGGGLSEYPQ